MAKLVAAGYARLLKDITTQAMWGSNIKVGSDLGDVPYFEKGSVFQVLSLHGEKGQFSTPIGVIEWPVTDFEPGTIKTRVEFIPDK